MMKSKELKTKISRAHSLILAPFLARSLFLPRSVYRSCEAAGSLLLLPLLVARLLAWFLPVLLPLIVSSIVATAASLNHLDLFFNSMKRQLIYFPTGIIFPCQYSIHLWHLFHFIFETISLLPSSAALFSAPEMCLILYAVQGN